MSKKRIEIIDALRGLAVVLMVAHHLLYDFVEFLGAPEWLFSNPVFDFLHYVFAGLFIFLSGVSSRFSRSNVQRGLKVLAIAVVISIVTYFMDMPIRFGVLHLLGFAMVFFGLTRRVWDSIPEVIAPFLYTALLVTGALVTALVKINSPHLWMLGWTVEGFESFDYFPILPWLFPFLLGTWAGIHIKAGRLPKWFYDADLPVFPAIGRKALLIYVVHQPVLYGFVMGIAYFIR